MNTVMLNTVHLDGAPIIKKGSGGGGGVTINNQSKSVDIVENGTTEIVADSGYTGLGKVSVNVNVPSSGGGIKYTGHADAEGLRAIGWTDDDIAYYQANGVNWNEEDDEYHKVTDDNKALYGVLTANNIADYKERIVYLPKIDTSNVTSMWNMLKNCKYLVAIPLLDTQNVTNMNSMFSGCYCLMSVPLLDTKNVTIMNSMFSSCYSLVSIPQFDTSNVTSMWNMLENCYSLVSIPQFDTQNVTDMSMMFANCHSLNGIPELNFSKLNDTQNMFTNCYSLVSVPKLDTSNCTYMTGLFDNCYTLTKVPELNVLKTSLMPSFSSCFSLTYAQVKNIKNSISFSASPLLLKESLLYIINNESATSAITIKLHSYAYERLATDADVVEALNNHPNITLAK